MSDLVSRSALLERISKVFVPSGGFGMGIQFGIDTAKDWITEAPAVDAVPVVHAHWKFNRDGSGTCSNCRRTQTDAWDYDSWDNYCSSCGAKMDGGKANATD